MSIKKFHRRQKKFKRWKIFHAAESVNSFGCENSGMKISLKGRRNNLKMKWCMRLNVFDVWQWLGEWNMSEGNFDLILFPFDQNFKKISALLLITHAQTPASCITNFSPNICLFHKNLKAMRTKRDHLVINLLNNYNLTAKNFLAFQRIFFLRIKVSHK